MQDTEGNLDIDTGSGSIELLRVRSPALRVDTGSGSVHCENVTADEIKSIDQSIRKIVNESADFAESAPEPEMSELYTDVLVEAY